MVTLPGGLTSPSAANPPSSAARPGCFTYLLFAAAGLWAVAASILIHVIAWSTDQALSVSSNPIPGFVWTLISCGHGLALAAPIVLLAVFTSAPRFRAAYQTWSLAIGYIAVLGLARAFPVTWTQPAALTQIALSLLSVIGLSVFTLFGLRRRLGLRLGALPPALSLGPIVIFPSLVWGALGSPLDTLLNTLAGTSLGLFAGVLLGVFLIQPLREHTSGPGWDMAFGGLAAGIALVILGSGFGFGGTQLLLLIVLPPLGFAVMGVSRFAGIAPDVTERTWLPIAGLVGLAAAVPLVFVDPDEMTLLLGLPGGGELLDWALRAAWLSLLLALAVGAGLWVFRRRITGPPHLALSLGGLAVTWLAGLLMYGLVGQPGFYGEQLFVILRDQADLTPAYSISDRDERLRYVYQTLTQHADATQAGLRAALDLVRAEYQPYYLVNAIEVNGGPLLRAYLAFRPEVDRVIDSPRLRPLPAPLPVGEGSESGPDELPWNITSIGADRVWEELGVTGEGIVVGQSDSGVQGDHPALQEGYRGRSGGDNYNWFDPWNGTTAPTDVGGHGTATLGSILGRGGLGVAPGAQWFGCVNLARNLGNPPFYLDCMQFMLAPYPQGGDPFKDGDPTRAAHVLNNSWGCPPLEGCDAGSLGPGVSALRAAGIFVVASAGNDGPTCSSVNSPLAIYDDAFSVGAVDPLGQVATFSSRGPVVVDASGRVKPDLLAPGVEVLSSRPGSSYGTASGTSIAGPHVVGTVALIWAAQPGLIGNVDRTEEILIETARPYTGVLEPCGDTSQNVAGHGLLDAYAAVKVALEER